LTNTTEKGKAEKETTYRPIDIPLLNFQTGYKISNTKAITHIRTFGNIKLIFQISISRIILEVNASSVGKKIVTNPSKNITAMRLICFLLKRTRSQWPGFYAVVPEKHSPFYPGS